MKPSRRCPPTPQPHAAVPANKELPDGPAFLAPTWENHPHPRPPRGNGGARCGKELKSVLREGRGKRLDGGGENKSWRRTRGERLDMFLTGSQRRREAAASKQQPRMFCLGTEHPLQSSTGYRPGGVRGRARGTKRPRRQRDSGWLSDSPPFPFPPRVGARGTPLCPGTPITTTFFTFHLDREDRADRRTPHAPTQVSLPSPDAAFPLYARRGGGGEGR